MMRRICMVALIVLTAAGVHAGDLVTERRKDQFPKEQGYYVFPSPYSIPGVGYGLAAIGIGRQRTGEDCSPAAGKDFCNQTHARAAA